MTCLPRTASGRKIYPDARGSDLRLFQNRFDAGVLEALFNLAREHNLKDRIEDMFTGKKINVTENRAVLHTALRNFRAGR